MLFLLTFKVRMVFNNGSMVTIFTMVGSSSLGCLGNYTLGSIYVMSNSQKGIMKLTLVNGYVQGFANIFSNNPATLATFVVEKQSNSSNATIYYSDNGSIMKFDESTGIVSTLVSDSMLTSTSFLCKHNSTLFVSTLSQIYQVLPDLTLKPIIGIPPYVNNGTTGYIIGYNGNGHLANETVIYSGKGLIVTDDEIYFSDFSSASVRVMSRQDGRVRPYAGMKPYINPGEMATKTSVAPLYLALTSKNDILFSVYQNGQRGRGYGKIDTNGRLTFWAGFANWLNPLSHPEQRVGTIDNFVFYASTTASIVESPNGDIIASDYYRMFRYAQNGSVSVMLGALDESVPIQHSFMTYLPSGDLIYVERSFYRIQKMSNLDGSITTIAGMFHFFSHIHSLFTHSSPYRKYIFWIHYGWH